MFCRIGCRFQAFILSGLLLVSGAIPIRAQTHSGHSPSTDSLFAIGKDKTQNDSVRMNALYRASHEIYKDVPYGLEITATYLAAARECKRPTDEMAALSFLGMGYFLSGNLDSADYCFRNQLALSESHGDIRKKSDAMANLGLVYGARGKLDSALILHNQSLAISVANNFNVQEERAKINIGDIYERQGKYKESIATFGEALDLCLKNHDAGFYPAIYISLGDINHDLGEDTTAARYYRLALEASVNVKNSNKHIQSLEKIGSLFEADGQPDSALAYYSKAYDLAREQELPLYLAITRRDMASICQQRGNTALALQYATESIALFEQCRIVNGSEDAYILAGEIEMTQGHNTESLSYLNKGYAIANNNNKIKSLERASRLLYEVHKRMGNTPAALRWLEQYDSLHIVISDRDNIRSVIRLQLNNEYRKKLSADSLANAQKIEQIDDDHRKAQEEQTRNFRLAVAGAGVLLILFFAGLLVSRRFKRINTELNRKNSEIGQALKDKEVLLREVHHRVKNNMQVVSSLLELKSRSASSDQAREALLDSHTRITAMQLAHQKMYLSDNYEELEVTEYCREITSLLLRTGDHVLIPHSVNGEPLFIHVEQAQSLGFILHELISNSIRHAWEADDKHRIVNISCTLEEKNVHFTYTDNGKGLPADFNPACAQSFGMRLVYSLVERQLMGTMKVIHGSGTQIEIEFTPR